MEEKNIYENVVALIRAKDYDNAMERLQTMIDDDPEDAWAHMYMGICYARLDKKIYAIASLEEAFRHNEAPIICYNLGTAYQMAMRIDEAVRQFKTALDITPDYKPAINALEKLSEGFVQERPLSLEGEPPLEEPTIEEKPEEESGGFKNIFKKKF